MHNHPLADKSSLSGIRRAIRAELVDAGVDPAAAFDCLVALTEACSNALVHGASEDDRPAEVSWSISEREARFEVRDFSARGWEKTSHPSTDDEERVGGFGIDLMRGLMDEVQVETLPAGTLVRMVKRIRS